MPTNSLANLGRLTDELMPTLEAWGKRLRNVDQRWLVIGGATLLAAAVVGGALAVRQKGKRMSDKEDDKVIARAVTVNKPRAELYRYWRDFTNAPRFMEMAESVTDSGGGRSHWILRGPGRKKLEYDAVITADEPDRLIVWESAPGADVRSTNRIEFRDAPGDRGTEIHAAMTYDPPMGALGKVVATVTQRSPELQVLRDLKRFKMLMETGEIATTEGPGAAPAGRKQKSH